MSRLLKVAPVVWACTSVAAALVFVVLVMVAPVESEVFSVDRGDLLLAPIGPAFAVVGALIARRVPRNPVGWLLGAYGTVFVCGRLGAAYAAQGLLGDMDRPGAAVVNWLVSYEWAVALLLLATALLHFPDGRLPSPRWRALPRCAVAIAAVLPLQWALLLPVRDNPMLLRDTSAFPPAADLVATILELPVMALTMLGVLSVVVRYRAAGSMERTQLRGLFLAVGLVALGVGWLQVTDTDPTSGAPVAALVLLGLGLFGIPVAIGVAVLRYRLYDVDRLVSRTVAYALVLGILGGAYMGSVVVLGAAGRAATGESGDLVVALSTLGVAALARPVLARVRAAVDRRFDRARYDAARTIDAFGRGLRHETSLVTAADRLRGVTASTFRPSSVGVVLVERTVSAGGVAGPVSDGGRR